MEHNPPATVSASPMWDNSTDKCLRQVLVIDIDLQGREVRWRAARERGIGVNAWSAFPQIQTVESDLEAHKSRFGAKQLRPS